MALFTSDDFKSVADAIKSHEVTGSQTYKEVLKLKAGNTYVLRFLPNMKDKAKSVFEFQKYNWNSFCTGKFVSALSLQTFGKSCPIGLEKFRISKTGTPEEQEKAKKVKWQKQYYINVYVVDDPTTPKNNGTVKVLRMGSKLYNKFESALKGEDSDEFGPAKIFNLGPEGVNFKLKVTEQGNADQKFINYDDSRFTGSVDLKLTEDQIKEIYESVHNLEEIEFARDEESLKKLWSEHFLCEQYTGGSASKPSQEAPSKVTKTVSETVETTSCDVDDDIDVDSMLKDLNLD